MKAMVSKVEQNEASLAQLLGTLTSDAFRPSPSF
jgi:hypothetical protein